MKLKNRLLRNQIIEKLKFQKEKLEEEKQFIIERITSKWDEETLSAFNHLLRKKSEGIFDECSEEEAKLSILYWNDYRFTLEEYSDLCIRIGESCKENILKSKI